MNLRLINQNKAPYQSETLTKNTERMLKATYTNK